MVLLAQENPDYDLIIDLAAQTSARLGKWIEESDSLSLFQEIGSQVYLWHVLDDGADSVNLLNGILNRYPQEFIKFVVVSNLGRGECFDHFEQSTTYKKAKDRDATFMTLTKLQPQLAARLDFNNTSFWAAANNSDVMNIIERSRVRTWLKNNYQQFDKLIG